MKKNNNMLLDVNDKPPVLKWILLSLQHVFAMFGATILVPILVNSAAGSNVLSIPVALVSSGIGTLIYIACTRAKSPVFLGSSFAFIAPVVAAYIAGGLGGGSADLSATLRGLNRLWNLGLSIDELASIALKFGSDTLFTMYNKPGIIRGRGVCGLIF